MSLAFLSKKKFHTTNLRNVEEVWKREKAQYEEERKTEERKRELEEERELERVQELQEKSGLINRSLTERAKLGWMYQGPAAIQTKGGISSSAMDDFSASFVNENSDYLDGKKSANEFLKEKEREEKAKSWERSMMENHNEQFRRLNEDPLFMMKRQELEALEKVKNNPLKMEEAKKRAIKLLEKKHGKKKKKKEKRFKHRKESRRRSHSLSHERIKRRRERSPRQSERSVKRRERSPRRSERSVKRRERGTGRRDDNERRNVDDRRVVSTHKGGRKRKSRMDSAERERRLREFLADGQRREKDREIDFEAAQRENKDSLKHVHQANSMGNSGDMSRKMHSALTERVIRNRR